MHDASEAKFVKAKRSVFAFNAMTLCADGTSDTVIRYQEWMPRFVNI